MIDDPHRAAHLQLGRNLRRLRADRGLSQEQLAAAAELTRGYYGALERGEHSPSFASLLKLARALNTDVSEIVEVVT